MQAAITDCIPQSTKVSAEEWSKVTKGYTPGPDAMTTEWYAEAHDEEVKATMIRSTWERKKVWEGWVLSMTGSETVEEMEAEVKKIAETAKGATPIGQGTGKGKGKGKGKSKKRPLQEAAKTAAEIITDVKNTAKRRKPQPETITCPACDLTTPGPNCIHCGTPSSCSCRLRNNCNACTTFNERAVTVRLTRNSKRSLGLCFKSTLLVRTTGTQASQFLGHHINLIGAYRISTASDIIPAMQYYSHKKDVTVTFHPRYLSHDVIKGLGLKVPTRGHDGIGKLGGLQIWRERPLVFGEGLTLENIAKKQSAGEPLFRCVPKSGDATAHGWCSKESLRKIYPSPFTQDPSGAVPTRKLTPGLECFRSAFRILYKEHESHGLFELFTRPVDPLRDGAVMYFSVIRTPMDLGTIRAYLDSGLYTKPAEVEADIAQVWTNCKIFNPAVHNIHVFCKNVEARFRAIIDEEQAKSGGDEEEEEDEDVPKFEATHALASEITEKISELPRHSSDHEALAAQLTSVKGASRWSLCPHPRSGAEVTLSLIPGSLPSELAVSVLKSIQQVKVAE